MNTNDELTKEAMDKLKQAIADLAQECRVGTKQWVDCRASANQWSKQLKELGFKISVGDILQDIKTALKKASEQEEQQKPVSEKPKLTEKELACARELGQRDLVKEFQRAFHIFGYVADENLTLAIMHTIFSRLLMEKTGWLYYGVSRSGKSKGLECGFRLLHPSNRLRATSMTPGAIFDLGHLDHKFILSGELKILRAGEDDPMQQLWRQFLSEPEISHHRLEEDKSSGAKKYVTRVVTVSGTASIAWTTTKNLYELKDEFALRLTSVKSNDSESITESVLNLKHRRAKRPKQTKSEEQEIIQIFNQFDLSLTSYDVVIPFADEIRPTNRDTSIRGIDELLLQHIQISALLNQHSRTIDPKGQLVATFDDYEAACKLVEGGAYRVSQGMSNEALVAYKKARKKWTDGDKFSYRQLEELLGKPRSTVQGYVKQWINAEAAEECADKGLNRCKLYAFLDYEPKGNDLGLVPGAEAKARYEEKLPKQAGDMASADRHLSEMFTGIGLEVPSSHLTDDGTPAARAGRTCEMPVAEELPNGKLAAESKSEIDCSPGVEDADAIDGYHSKDDLSEALADLDNYPDEE